MTAFPTAIHAIAEVGLALGGFGLQSRSWPLQSSVFAIVAAFAMAATVPATVPTTGGSALSSSDMEGV